MIILPFEVLVKISCNWLYIYIDHGTCFQILHNRAAFKNFDSYLTRNQLFFTQVVTLQTNNSWKCWALLPTTDVEVTNMPCINDLVF